MFFAEEPRAVALWWAELLDCPVERVHIESEFVWFDVGEIEFGFHPLDEAKNPVGGSPVVYLRVENFPAAVTRAESKGARLHRGPRAVHDCRSIAQLTDPFGNVFGLDGHLDRRSRLDQGDQASPALQANLKRELAE